MKNCWLCKWWSEADKLNVVISLAALVIGMCGLYVAYSQLIPQLQELNAKGKIITYFTSVSVGAATSTGYNIRFNPVIFNEGYGNNCFDADQWQVEIQFEPGVTVNSYDTQKWSISDSSTGYQHLDTKRILCALLDPYAQHGSVDNVGFFNINVRRRSNPPQDCMPVALIVSKGYRTPTVYRQVYFDVTTSAIKYHGVLLPGKENPYSFDINSCASPLLSF